MLLLLLLCAAAAAVCCCCCVLLLLLLLLLLPRKDWPNGESMVFDNIHVHVAYAGAKERRECLNCRVQR